MTTISYGNFDSAEFTPLLAGSEQLGEQSWVKEGRVYLWRATAENCPQTVPYPVVQEETDYVIEGSAVVTSGDERVELRPGDVATFEKGAETVWEFTFPFQKVAVLSD